MNEKPFFALGWQIGTLTGWGQFGAHFARTLSESGYRVVLPPGCLTDMSGVLPMDRPLLQSLVAPLPETGDGWLCMAIGNGMEERPAGLPSSIKVAGIMFCEDTGAIDATKLNAYDVIVAGSQWTQRVLEEKGVERVILAHQGYDSRVFFSDPRAYSQWNDSVGLPRAENQYLPEYPPEVLAKWRSRPYVFSGGKLEFRKGQDIVVEAFKRFRLTPEGKDAVLVVAWDNQWPATMEGIWLSGYVQGMPTVKHGRAEIVPWLIANGIPAEAVIDCGRLSSPELAQVMRSCTVGVFPNRAESGTNLVLVEALACGLPVIVGNGHGHSDVLGSTACGLFANKDIPKGCRLYQSTDGWQELDPWEVSGVLAATLAHDHRMPLRQPEFDRSEWSWSVRGPAMAEAIVTMQFVPVQYLG